MKWLRQRGDERLEELQVDYAARLKALGMDENDIKEFDAYWQEQRTKLRWSD